jgi:ATP/maltotriose-dependent transcriptional regulator MalT
MQIEGPNQTLISAPAGFGKTTLVAEWVRSLKEAGRADGIAWHSLDEDDNDLVRLRARGQLTELRASDLRFTSSAAAEFLNRVMGLALSTDDIAALEDRTEGWIAGLQLAALALQAKTSMGGHNDVPDFVLSFAGSHRFVLDYLEGGRE